MASSFLTAAEVDEGVEDDEPNSEEIDIDMMSV
jgi:hypothetical protein